MSNLTFDLSRALSLVVPNAKYFLEGNSIEGLEWKDEREIPTLEVLRAAIESDDLARSQRKVWANGEAFLRSLTLEELASISLSTDPMVAALRLLLVSRHAEVWSDDQELNLGLGRLVQLGLITTERKSAILAK